MKNSQSQTSKSEEEKLKDFFDEVKFSLGEALQGPASYQKVKDELSQYLVQTSYKDLGENKAFTLRRIGTLSGDIYKIFINSKEHPHVQKYLETHEAGHIILGHNSDEKTKDRINKMKIRAAWSKVQDRFPVAEDWEKKFDSIIYNIVMDMEVNSKLFTHEEMLALNKAIQGTGIWPEDFDFPVGLDYNTYLNLVLQDPKTFLDKLQDQQNNGQDGNSENSQSQDGDSSSKSEGSGSEDKSVGEDNYTDGNSGTDKEENQSQGNDGSDKNTNSSVDTDGKNSEKSNEKKNNSNKKRVRTGHKFTEEELKALDEYYKSHDEEKNEETAKELEEKEVEGVMPSSSYSSGSSITGHQEVKLNSVGITSFSEIKANLTKLVTKSTSMNKRDILYNYNRNKHNSNVLVPRVIKSERKNPACMYVLLDVSGSISQTSICRFVETFKEVASSLNKASRIILWDTELVSDNSVKDDIEAISGGGTRMAAGVRYISRKYKPTQNDYFIMVSDFQDNLDDWNDELSALKCNKLAYIFSYGSSEESCKEVFDEMGEYINSYSSEPLTEMINLWKNTKGINISRDDD